ncbi:basic proline-rich protein-like [Hyaena hyaena]|uniref:basic proline-rich protein-like n=1 Tax=Hyaena hyaena TaxID=95912 RepID=UPI00192325EE|nr:basic proline-rich protein-like [Hyaena hyaena]
MPSFRATSNLTAFSTTVAFRAESGYQGRSSTFEQVRARPGRPVPGPQRVVCRGAWLTAGPHVHWEGAGGSKLGRARLLGGRGTPRARRVADEGPPAPPRTAAGGRLPGPARPAPHPRRPPAGRWPSGYPHPHLPSPPEPRSAFREGHSPQPRSEPPPGGDPATPGSVPLGAPPPTPAGRRTPGGAPLSANAPPATADVTGRALSHWPRFPSPSRGTEAGCGPQASGGRCRWRLQRGREGAPRWASPGPLWETGPPRSRAEAATPAEPGSRKSAPPAAAPPPRAEGGAPRRRPRGGVSGRSPNGDSLLDLKHHQAPLLPNLWKQPQWDNEVRPHLGCPSLGSGTCPAVSVMAAPDSYGPPASPISTGGRKPSLERIKMWLKELRDEEERDCLRGPDSSVHDLSLLTWKLPAPSIVMGNKKKPKEVARVSGYKGLEAGIRWVRQPWPGGGVDLGGLSRSPGSASCYV